MLSEAAYQVKLIKKLKILFPECLVVKNDSSQNQGIPDLTLFYGLRWIMLEVKNSLNAPEQPNQRYHIEQLSKMSFAAFICPETEDEVLDELQRILG